MHSFVFTTLFYAVLLFLTFSGCMAYALPLMNTDDAGIVEDKHCQLELHQVYQKKAQQVLFSPACNIGTVEVSVPLAYDDGSQSYAFQLKRPFYDNGHVGVAGSVFYQPVQSDRPDEWQFNLPVSVYDIHGVQVDANLGLKHLHDDDQVTWALAGTLPLSAAHHFSLEVYKTAPGHTAVQSVLHIQVIPEKLNLYAAYGRELQADTSSWVGMGLSWTTAVF
ncbi:hypothetical protein [Acinetobacter sp. WZC-1]|uniref:hypothetical protein n=1 Tax=Acinetobacter sp. WZC-1 TaxID=3459034 RepID=UPI00403D841D